MAGRERSRFMDGLTDAEIGAAATNVAVHRRVYILIRGLGNFRKKRGSRHHLPGLAIAALWDVQVGPSELDGMRTVERQAFDRGDVRIVGSGDWRLAGAHCATPEMHGTRAALTDAAPIFGAAQVEDVAENPQKRDVLRHVDPEGFPVHNKFVGHKFRPGRQEYSARTRVQVNAEDNASRTIGRVWRKCQRGNAKTIF